MTDPLTVETIYAGIEADLQRKAENERFHIWDAGFKAGLRAAALYVAEIDNPPEPVALNPYQFHQEARDTRPHSRACGIRMHEHGSACHPNCPTCRGGGK